MLDYAEHNEAAVYSEHKTLDGAVKAAKDWLKLGNSTFGCCLIDHEVFEPYESGMFPEWERQKTFEVAMDFNEVIEVG